MSQENGKLVNIEEKCSEWLAEQKRQEPEILEWLSEENLEKIRQNVDAVRQEIVQMIKEIVQNSKYHAYKRTMMDSLKDLKYKVWQYIEGIQNERAPGGCHIEYFSEEQLMSDFEELGKCAECLESGSKRLETEILLEIFDLSYNLQNAISSITFFKHIGEEPSDVFRWKSYFKQTAEKTP